MPGRASCCGGRRTWPAPAAPAPVATDDVRIRDAYLAEMRKQSWAGLPDEGNVIVDNGVVHLWGIIQSEEERKAMIVAAENTPGVKQVVDHMGYRVYTGL